MKLWFRIKNFEFCSWFIVYKHLMKGFQRIKAQVPESPFKPPNGNAENYVEMFWGDPAYFSWWEGEVRARVALVLSEHRSLLRPDEAIANLQDCDLLLCPCESAAVAFYEAPINAPIHIVPFGVDDEEVGYYKRDWGGKIRFLLIGVAQFRKGSWLAVEAFRQAFKNHPDVSLTVASFVDSPMFIRLKKEYGEVPNIHFHGKAADVREYYHTHHVLVSPHLSEGWGLTIPEAMATGMPAIVARCSAPMEYFSSKWGWWMEMSDLYAPVDQCLPGVAGSWRLPSVDSLADNMIYAAQNPAECETKGRLASEYVLQNLTWKQSATQIINILKETYND